MSIKSRLEELKAQVAQAQEEYNQEVAKSRETVVRQLADYQQQIQQLVNEAEKLARSADLVFYYHEGYEEYNWVEEDQWNSSSMHC